MTSAVTHQSVTKRIAIATYQIGKIFRFRVERLLKHSVNMEKSWISETSSEMFNYLYHHVTGEEEETVATPSSSLSALSQGVWITDLPTNDYEPLENSPVAKKVGVSFFSSSFFFFLFRGIFNLIQLRSTTLRNCIKHEQMFQ